MIRRALFVIVLPITFGYAVGLCVSGCITPKQAADATKAGCTIVEAFAPDATVESICAAAPTLAELAAAALAARVAAADAGARSAGQCKVIPTTAVCATNAETLVAIRAVKAAHP